MGVREISLTQGMVAIVDAADYEWLNQWKWRSFKHRKTFYAVREASVENGVRTVLMHRLIMGNPVGVEIDPQNRNGLCNLRENLRIATRSQNS